MKAFPMFIRTTGRNVVLVGGGEQAAQKARLLLKSDAHLVIVAAALEDELAGLVQEGRASHITELSTRTLRDAAMVFIGTGCPGFDAAAHGVAKAAGCMVNVVDQPDLCDMTTPAIVDRDPIVVAIGSEGTSPVLTRDIKTKLEEMLPSTSVGWQHSQGVCARALPAKFRAKNAAPSGRRCSRAQPAINGPTARNATPPAHQSGDLRRGCTGRKPAWAYLSCWGGARRAGPFDLASR